MSSEAPLSEHAIPNDYIPPVTMSTKRAHVGTPRIGPPKPSPYRNFDPGKKPYITADSTNSDSDVFTPDLSTVTEEDSAWINKAGKISAHLKSNISPGYIPGMTRSDPYLFEQRSPMNKDMYHLTWVNPEMTPGFQAKLDKRQIRSDPSISGRNRSSVVSSIPSLETVTESYAEHLPYDTEDAPVGPSLSTTTYPSPFHPHHNTPTGGSENEIEVHSFPNSVYPCNVMFDYSSKVIEGAPDRLASLNSSYPSSFTSTSSYAQDVMQAVSESGRKVRLFRSKDDRCDMSCSSTDCTSSDAESIARPRPRGVRSVTFEKHGSGSKHGTPDLRPDFPCEDLARRFSESVASSTKSNISGAEAILMHSVPSALTTEASESYIPDSTGGTLTQYDSGLQAPPGSKDSSVFTTDKSFSLTQSKLYPVELYEPNLRQVLSASRTSSHRSRRSRSCSRLRNMRPKDYIIDFHVSVGLASTDTSMCPQVGSSCNTSEIHNFHHLDNSATDQDFGKSGGNVMNVMENESNRGNSTARLRTKSDVMSPGLMEEHAREILHRRRRAYSQDNQVESPQESLVLNNDYDWDSYYPSPFEDTSGHNRDLGEFGQNSPTVRVHGENYGRPILSTKQYWV
jgi:hypothetical protein